MPIDLSQPQFFFDDTLIADTRSLHRHWLPADVYPEPVLRADRPWEGRSPVLYGTILPHPQDGYRLYYSSFSPSNDVPRTVMLATSRNGFHWEKPEVGAVEFEGSTKNNIVCQLPDGMMMDSPSIMLDPHDPAAPYKLICFGYHHNTPAWSDGWGMYGLTSRDGLHWDLLPGGPHLVAGDRSNLLTSKLGDKYVLYTRHRHMTTQEGVRSVYRSTSDNFRTWTEPQLVLKPDLTDAPDVQFYGMPVFQRHGWFIGLLEYWRADADVIEIHLALSRDSLHWWRPMPHTPFIAASYPWNKTWSTCASNGPIIINEQMVFYFGGRWAAHHWDSARQHGVIGYASLGLDRFCAIEGRSGGVLTTVPITWPGGNLTFNADCRQSFDSHPGHTNGKIEVEVLDAAGQPLPDWSGDKKAVWTANTHCRGNIWQPPVLFGDRSLDALKGQTIRLRLTLTHARLFTLEAKRA